MRSISLTFTAEFVEALLDEVDELDVNVGGWMPPTIDVLRLHLWLALPSDRGHA